MGTYLLEVYLIYQSNQNECFYEIWQYFDERKCKNRGLKHVRFRFSIVQLSHTHLNVLQAVSMDILEYIEVENFKIETSREVSLAILNVIDIKQRPQTPNLFDVIINCHFSSNSVSNIK